MLEAREVHLRRGGRPVLAGVSLALAPGELVAVVGPNGAGKSSLLAVLAGDLRPDRGAALLDGRPIAGFSVAALAAERAVLEQAPGLTAPFTVAGLVALGLAAVPGDFDEAAVAAGAMAAAGVAGLAARPADRLSGGERARAHLARVLAQLRAGRAGGGGGRFLLLDEPTASLDLGHQVAAMRAVRAEAAAGAGVLAVLHDLNLAAAFADRVVLLCGGRVEAAGTPAEVLEPERLSAAYGAPILVERRAGGLGIVPDLPAAALAGAGNPD